MPSRSFRRREVIDGYLFASLGFTGFILLVLGPLLASLVLSLTQWRILQPPTFVGLDNYAALMNDRVFWQSLKVTSIYVIVGVPLGMTWAFMIAQLMNQGVKGIALWRTIYYMPSVISGVVMALIWIWVFNPDWGIVNNALSRIGIQGPGWFYDSQWALMTLILLSLWTAGGSMVIYLAGLQGIPTQLYEAASMDGANAFSRFWHITIPMMTPVLLFQLVMGVIGSFQAFTPAYIGTGGGPANSTLFYNLYLYRNAFEGFRMGYASAQAWILFMIVLVCTLIILKQSRHWVHYEGMGQ